MLVSFFFALLFNICYALKNTTTESVDANGLYYCHAELVDDGLEGKFIITYID